MDPETRRRVDTILVEIQGIDGDLATQAQVLARSYIEQRPYQGVIQRIVQLSARRARLVAEQFTLEAQMCEPKKPEAELPQ